MTLANRVLKILNEKGENKADILSANKYIKLRDFQGLFNYLGWNKKNKKIPFQLSVADVEVNSVAELGGFTVLEVVSKNKLLTKEKIALQEEINNVVKNNMLVFNVGGEVIFRHSSGRMGTEVSSKDRVSFPTTIEKLYFTKDEPKTLSDVVEKVNTALNYS